MQVRDYLADMELIHLGQLHCNLAPAKLVEHALQRGEGVLAANGALAVVTGRYTGRSPSDRFIVDTPAVHDKIDWGKINQPMSPVDFDHLYYRLAAYLEEMDLYIFDGYCGADADYRISVRVVNQYAWQNLFVHQLLIRPDAEALATFVPEFTMICAPGFHAHPHADHTRSEAFVLLNLEKKMIIIGGTSYAGEMKKAIFTTMNYLLPEYGICPMHCSANMGPDNDVALFFGLSGTGKTTLSADHGRRLIGDDEHGWSADGIFNFEGGCYAKCIHLSRKHEPQIWDAIRFGSVLENVKLDEKTRVPDYNSDELTENTRAAYPLEYIEEAELSGEGGPPSTILFLSADAFGVLPPITRLTAAEAVYYYLSGYTSKLAGTERGITEPQATFSTGFGEPFLPRPPMEYARILQEKISQHQSRVFLVNTGWTGGPYGIGERMSLLHTRQMIRAAIAGDLDRVPYRYDPVFGFAVPTECPGIPGNILDPRSTWADGEAYDRAARQLADSFIRNFARFSNTDEAVQNAGPKKAIE
jgi:phosphoenolpyruvate carboxykinase (ATP)